MIGSKVWFRRSYTRVWTERTITGETTKSWIIPEGKISKKTHTFLDSYNGCLVPVCFSESEKAKYDWIDAHRYHVSEAVRRCNDFDVLLKIAELVGYEP